MRVAALADDTSGALEVGAQFAGQGVRAPVMLELELASQPLEAGALVVDMQTRHLEPQAARERVTQILAWARAWDLGYVYLKTDSTLRGPIGAQFEALLDTWPERPLVYVPGYPAMGRQVRDGVLLVEGRPLCETPFARDLLNPVREGDIVRLLAATCRAPAMSVQSAEQLRVLLQQGDGRKVLVCDASTESELEAIAAVLAPHAQQVLVAGTGGFAGYWVRNLPVERQLRSWGLGVRRWLVVNGSLHPRSREQIARACLPELESGGTATSGWGWAVLPKPARPGASPAEIASALGREAARIIREQAVGGVVVFGGDTVRAVLRALGASLIEPCGELLPGVPISRLPTTDLVLVTKAGGFGPVDVLLRIREEVDRRACSSA